MHYRAMLRTAKELGVDMPTLQSLEAYLERQ